MYSHRWCQQHVCNIYPNKYVALMTPSSPIVVYLWRNLQNYEILQLVLKLFEIQVYLLLYDGFISLIFFERRPLINYRKRPRGLLLAIQRFIAYMLSEFDMPLEQLGTSWVYQVSETGEMRVIFMSLDSIDDYYDPAFQEYDDSSEQESIKFWLYTR